MVSEFGSVGLLDKEKKIPHMIEWRGATEACVGLRCELVCFYAMEGLRLNY
jgi:hypothetical protein